MERETVRITLFYPPSASASQPYPALPALAAYLRMQGNHDPTQWDANIGYLRSALTHDGMAQAARAVEVMLAGIHQRPQDLLKSQEQYVALARAALKAPFLVEGIDAAVNELQTWECYCDLGRLDRARRLVQEGLEMLSLASYPLGLSFFNTPVEALTVPDMLQRWAKDEERNPFRAYFAASVLPAVEANAPDAIGISISFRGQVLGAATLASMVRQALPSLPIILGGNLVSIWQDCWQDLGALFDWCDYLVPFEGETALDSLLTSLESGGPLDGVPNLIYREGGKVRRTPAAIEDLDALPTPDYAGLPLDQYLAPDTVFSLYTSRGCYWGRCAFCAVSPAMRLGYRRRSAQRIHNDIRTIGEVYGGRYITFADDCVSPTALREIAAAVEGSGQKIVWQAEVRFEQSLTDELLQRLRSTGCANLVFGFESVSPRLRGLMGKGTADQDIQRILAECRRLGIAFNLQFFFGFPGEQSEEADETVSFVLAEAHGAATFSFGTFELQKGSRVERTPEAYGVTRVARDAGLLAVKFDYKPVLDHVAPTSQRLQRLLSERMTYLHTGLSMNAHTLFVLGTAGPESLAALYKPPDQATDGREVGAEVADLMNSRITRSPTLHARRFLPLDACGPPAAVDESDHPGQILVYDYDQDTTLAVSPTAMWILEQLDGSQTLAEFLASLSEDSVALSPSALTGLAKELYRRRFLVCAGR